MAPEWPYMNSMMGNTSGIPQPSGIHGQYSSNSVGPLPSPAAASFTGMTQVSRAHQPNSGATNSYAPLSGRQDHSLSYGVNPSDGSFDTFGYTSAQYQTQTPDAHGASVPYGTQDYPRNWPVAGPSSRWTPLASFDQDYSARYATSSYPYANPSVGPTLEGNPSFPTMSSLASSLPGSMSSDRLLPHPRDSLAPQLTDRQMSTNQGILNESASYMPSQGTSSKMAVPWLNDRTTTAGSQNSVGTVLGSNAHLVREARSKSSSSASESQETPFGYVVPLQHSPPRAGSPLTSEYTPTSSASSTIALENQLYPGKPPYIAESPSNLLSGHSASSTNLYTYSTGSSANRGSYSSSSGGTLSSGQPYTQLRQTQPQSGLQLENLRRSSTDRTSRNHRPSVSNANITRRWLTYLNLVPGFWEHGHYNTFCVIWELSVTLLVMSIL